jgi:ESX secretion system protein EccC
MRVTGDQREDAVTQPLRGTHRPQRTWPTGPTQQPLILAAPPVRSDVDSGGWLLTLLPLLGSLGLIASAFVLDNNAYRVIAVLLVMAMVAGTVGGRVLQRRREARRWARQRERFLTHAAEVDARARTAAAAQRAALLQVHPDPAALLTSVRSEVR